MQIVFKKLKDTRHEPVIKGPILSQEVLAHSQSHGDWTEKGGSQRLGCFMGTELQFGKTEKIWRRGGGGCTAK